MNYVGHLNGSAFTHYSYFCRGHRSNQFQFINSSWAADAYLNGLIVSYKWYVLTISGAVNAWSNFIKLLQATSLTLFTNTITLSFTIWPITLKTEPNCNHNWLTKNISQKIEPQSMFRNKKQISQHKRIQERKSRSFLRTKKYSRRSRKPVERHSSGTTVLMSMNATTDTSVNIIDWWNVRAMHTLHSRYFEITWKVETPVESKQSPHRSVR